MRRDPRRRRRRPGRGPAGPHLQTDDGDIALKCPTEIAITDRREKELSDLGFIPLVHCKNTDYAAFFGAQSAQKPKLYNTDAANANARLSTQFQYILAVVAVRPLPEGDDARQDRQLHEPQPVRDVPQHLDHPVRHDRRLGQPGDQGAVSRCARPGSTSWKSPASPACYKAIAFLRPHFQLDELTVSLRLVAELPPPASGELIAERAPAW